MVGRGLGDRADRVEHPPPAEVRLVAMIYFEPPRPPGFQNDRLIAHEGRRPQIAAPAGDADPAAGQFVHGQPVEAQVRAARVFLHAEPVEAEEFAPALHVVAFARLRQRCLRQQAARQRVGQRVIDIDDLGFGGLVAGIHRSLRGPARSAARRIDAAGFKDKVLGRVGADLQHRLADAVALVASMAIRVLEAHRAAVAGHADLALGHHAVGKVAIHFRIRVPLETDLGVAAEKLRQLHAAGIKGERL